MGIDLLGGDEAPVSLLEGASEALQAWTGEWVPVFVGPKAALDRGSGLPGLTGDVEWLPAPHSIEPGEAPAHAVRRKPDSSIVVGIRALQEGQIDAFISAGSTGAMMAASVLFLGKLPDVDRVPVGALFPTSEGRALVLDAGANVDCRPEHLLTFAHLGSIYMQGMLGVDRPRVGLLNVGEEPEKGDELAVAAHRLLAADSTLEFVGNVEGRDIIRGRCDVLVCDGFVGNVLLKFYESIAGLVLGVLRRHRGDGDDFESLFRFLDYTEYGGAPLLGVNGVSIICHGASPPRAIRNAIRAAVDAVECDMVGAMTRDLLEMERSGAA